MQGLGFRPSATAFLAAALIAGAPSLLIWRAASPALAEEDHSAHHPNAGETTGPATAKEGDHSGHAMSPGGGMMGCKMMEGGMQGGGMQGCAMMGEGKGGHAGMGAMKDADDDDDHDGMKPMSPADVEKRVTSLENALMITEAQRPQWKNFAAALRSVAEFRQTMHREMMQPTTTSLPERLEAHEKMVVQHLTVLKTLRAALDPLYASFSDEQKKVANSKMTGRMGLI